MMFMKEAECAVIGVDLQQPHTAGSKLLSAQAQQEMMQSEKVNII